MRLWTLLAAAVIFVQAPARADTASCLALSSCADVSPIIAQCAAQNAGCAAPENGLAVTLASLVDDAIIIQGCNRAFRSARDCSRCFGKAKELASLTRQSKKLFGVLAAQVRDGLELKRRVICEGAATEFVVLNGNLDSRVGVSALPGGAPTFAELAAAASFQSSVTVIDSLGATHAITIYFVHTGTNSWTMALYVDGGEVGSTAGFPALIGTSALSFDVNGIRPQGAIQIDLTAVVPWSNGAAANPFALYANLTQRAFPSTVTATTR